MGLFVARPPPLFQPLSTFSCKCLMVIRYKPGSCCTEAEVFTNQRHGEKNTGLFFLCTWLLAVLRWPACGEWIMSVHLCEAVPCPPARRGCIDEYTWSCCEWTARDDHDELMHKSNKLYTETLTLWWNVM